MFSYVLLFFFIFIIQISLNSSLNTNDSHYFSYEVSDQCEVFHQYISLYFRDHYFDTHNETLKSNGYIHNGENYEECCVLEHFNRQSDNSNSSLQRGICKLYDRCISQHYGQSIDLYLYVFYNETNIHKYLGCENITLNQRPIYEALHHNDDDDDENLEEEGSGDYYYDDDDSGDSSDYFTNLEKYITDNNNYTYTYEQNRCKECNPFKKSNTLMGTAITYFILIGGVAIFSIIYDIFFYNLYNFIKTEHFFFI